MRFLILHGPNLNIIGLKSAKDGSKITLDKINKHIRRCAKKYDVECKFLQTNEEGKAVNFLQRNRHKTNGIILFPSSWQYSAYALVDTLDILDIPFITISTGEKLNLLQGIDNVSDENVIKGCETGIETLYKSISDK